MTQDEIQAVARAICAKVASLDSDEADEVWPDWIGEAEAAVIALDAARGDRVAQSVRAATLEQAARIADSHDTGDCTREDMEARRIAAAIRAKQAAKPTGSALPIAHPPADRVAQVVEWLRSIGSMPAAIYADAIERGEPFNG